MDNVIYYHPRCSFSKDLLGRVGRLPKLAAALTTVDVSVSRPRHRIAEVPCIVYEGRVYQGREAFQWLSAIAGQYESGQSGTQSSGDTLPASECSLYSDGSTLRFVDFNAARPTVTMQPESYCDFQSPA